MRNKILRSIFSSSEPREEMKFDEDGRAVPPVLGLELDEDGLAVPPVLGPELDEDGLPVYHNTIYTDDYVEELLLATDPEAGAPWAVHTPETPEPELQINESETSSERAYQLQSSSSFTEAEFEPRQDKSCGDLGCTNTVCNCTIS